MTFWAACGLLQRLGSSARLFSPAKRAGALSQSKMPPQQRERLADGLGKLLGFGAHGRLLRKCGTAVRYCDLRADIGGQPGSVNAGGSWTVGWVKRSADPTQIETRGCRCWVIADARPNLRSASASFGWSVMSTIRRLADWESSPARARVAPCLAISAHAFVTSWAAAWRD